MFTRSRFVHALVLSGCVAVSSVRAQHVESREDPPWVQDSDDQLATRAMALCDVILDEHIDPPTRQEMVLAATGALYREARAFLPTGTSRRVSELATEDDARGFLRDLIAAVRFKCGVPADRAEEAVVSAILGSTPGSPTLQSAQERQIQEQLEGNRYVGIGIVIGYDRQHERVRLISSYPGGPARKAGAQDGDLIVSIDGASMKGVQINDVVQALRGPRGSKLSVVVRQPEEDKTRTLDMTRDVVPFASVDGFRRVGRDDWSYRVKADGRSIGYVRLNQIGASTVHELRAIEKQLGRDGVDSIIIDLRQCPRGTLHNAVLLADGLLDGGEIGHVRRHGGGQTFEAEAGCLFRGWPMAVLIGPRTSGQAGWVASALRANDRAALIGLPTVQTGYEITPVSMPDGDQLLMLATGILEPPNSGGPRPIAGMNAGVRPDVAVPGDRVGLTNGSHEKQSRDDRDPGVAAAVKHLSKARSAMRRVKPAGKRAG